MRHYCALAQEKNEHRMLAQGRFLNHDASLSQMTSDQDINDLQTQLQKWNTLTSEQLTGSERKIRKVRSVQEAKAYFDRKSPSLVACLNILALNFNPNPAPAAFEQPIKQPRIKRADARKETQYGYHAGEVDLQRRTAQYVETDGELSVNKTVSHSAHSSRRHSRGLSAGRNMLGRKLQAINKRGSRSSSLNANHDPINIISIATTNELNTPASAAQPITGTFREHG